MKGRLTIEGWCDVDEAARLLGMKPIGIIRAIQHGRLTGQRPNGYRWYVPIAELEEYHRRVHESRCASNKESRFKRRYTIQHPEKRCDKCGHVGVIGICPACAGDAPDGTPSWD